jgi:hypothetical protein
MVRKGLGQNIVYNLKLFPKMETIHIEIEAKINRSVEVTIPIADVIEGINEAPMIKRWNYIAQIINGVQTDLSDTTDEQKAMVKKYLTDKLSLF